MNNVVVTKDGAFHIIENKYELLNLIEEYMGEDIVEKINDLEYDLIEEQADELAEEYETQIADLENEVCDIKDEIYNIKKYLKDMADEEKQNLVKLKSIIDRLDDMCI